MIYLELVTAKSRMNIRWKRLALSLLSLLLASMLCSSALAGKKGFGPKAFIEDVFYFGAAIFLCSLPGWIVAIPVVLFVSNFNGWRLWAMLALGVGIGPLVMFTVALYLQVTSPNPSHYAPEARNLVFLATAVSALTTVLYLFGVRRLSSASLD